MENYLPQKKNSCPVMHDLEGNCKPQANYNYASVVCINKACAAVLKEKQTSHERKQSKS